MGLRSGLPNLGPPRRCVADLAAPIQLAPAAQQSTIKIAHHPPRSDRGQPVEAPHLASAAACRMALTGGGRTRLVWAYSAGVSTAAEVMRVPSLGRNTRTANSSMAASTIREATAAT